MSFANFDLSPRLLSTIAGLNYQQPTPIQAKTIPAALSGRDIIGCAETGSGKTAAFLLPIIEQILRGRQRQALVLSPTREIALQTASVAQALAQGTKLRSAVVIGGTSLPAQAQALAARPAIILATPGRLIDHMKRVRGLLDDVSVLVLDEADRLLDMGFLPDIQFILDHLSLERQSLLFSATLSQNIEELAAETLLEPVEVQIGRRAATVATLQQHSYPVNKEGKLPLLLHLLDQPIGGGTIIFTRTKHTAKRLCRTLCEQQHSAGVLHGDRSQQQRNSAIADFRAGRLQMLVATDLAARGIDISTIARVINYDVPAYAEDYVHRVGRTARAGKGGQALTFVTPQEEGNLVKIERLIGQRLTRSAMPRGFQQGARN